MNILNTLEAKNTQWEASFTIYSDTALIEKLNREIGNRSWTSSRGVYLICIANELKKRSFNSDVLFDFDTLGNSTAFKLKNKVKLINSTVEIIT